MPASFVCNGLVPPAFGLAVFCFPPAVVLRPLLLCFAETLTKTIVTLALRAEILSFKLVTLTFRAEILSEILAGNILALRANVTMNAVLAGKSAAPKLCLPVGPVLSHTDQNESMDAKQRVKMNPVIEIKVCPDNGDKGISCSRLGLCLTDSKVCLLKGLGSC